MKHRAILFIAIIPLYLASCNITFAEDVTPPPGYRAPTPIATLGPLFPELAPDPQIGALIYTEKCAACHGESGLGDGAQSGVLPVSVPPLGLPELARGAAPADWFLTVTQGNIEKFMPPFVSLNDQERWDVVAYLFTLSSTPEQITQGLQLFQEYCADCSLDIFMDLAQMAALSSDNLIDLLTDDNQEFQTLGEPLTAEELGAIAAYLRTLTFADSPLAFETAAPISSEEPLQTEPPSTVTPVLESASEEATFVGPTQQAEVTTEAPLPVAGSGTVTGTIINGSGGDAPTSLIVTLYGYEHEIESEAAPTEVFNQSVETDEFGVFLFDNIEILEERIYLAETAYEGIIFQSELIFGKSNTTQLEFPDLTVYESTTDPDGLVVEQLHISFDRAGESGLQVYELFSVRNLSDKAYVFTANGTSLPFLPIPENAMNVGLEMSQKSAKLVPTDEGFALPPSEDLYSFIVAFNLPYEKELEMSQRLALPVNSIIVIVPEGLKINSSQVTDDGIQQIQDGIRVQMYSGNNLGTGTVLEMLVSGNQLAAGVNQSDSQQNLLIGIGLVIVIIIIAGGWFYSRERAKPNENYLDAEQMEKGEFESAEEIIDAILAIDDLHRAKRIPEKAYQTRRAKLKAQLKDLV